MFMYLPYIRGKQNEVLGIREALSYPRYSEKISPIIEPVSKSMSTLKKTIEELKKCNSNFTLIVNPQVGYYRMNNAFEEIFDFISKNLESFDNFQIGVILHQNIDLKEIFQLLQANKTLCKAFSLIHNSEIKNIRQVLSSFSQISPVKFNVVNLDYISNSYCRELNLNTIVELKDYFRSQEKNIMYIAVGDSSFSDRHLYYKEDRYVGFSDYLTIGSKYSEGGGPAFAVAIHVSYINEDNVLRVKHFVSDSNEDKSDVAGKFSEALIKLEKWHNKQKNKSEVMTDFIKEYKHHYPGLGALKKLTLKNHLNLILQLI